MLPPQIRPYANHLNESHRFSSAVVYLIEANNLAEQMPETKLGKFHQDFCEALKGSYDYPRAYFLAQLFVARIACFELFLQETILLVIQKNPQKVGAKEFKPSEILELQDNSLLIAKAAEDI